jgi:hypothetical protein
VFISCPSNGVIYHSGYCQTPDEWYGKNVNAACKMEVVYYESWGTSCVVVTYTNALMLYSIDLILELTYEGIVGPTQEAYLSLGEARFAINGDEEWFEDHSTTYIGVGLLGSTSGSSTNLQVDLFCFGLFCFRHISFVSSAKFSTGLLYISFCCKRFLVSFQVSKRVNTFLNPRLNYVSFPSSTSISPVMFQTPSELLTSLACDAASNCSSLPLTQCTSLPSVQPGFMS